MPIGCLGCRQSVPDDAESCPRCGRGVESWQRPLKTSHSNPWPKTPRAWAFLVIIILVPISIVGWLSWDTSTDGSPGASVAGSITPPVASPPPAPAGAEASKPLGDTGLEAVARYVVSKRGLDVKSAQIADGTARGGERVLILAFKSMAASRAELYGEIATVFVCGYALNAKNEARLDSIIAIAGDGRGMTLCSATTTADNAGRMAREEITGGQYFKLWKWGPGYVPGSPPPKF